MLFKQTLNLKKSRQKQPFKTLVIASLFASLWFFAQPLHIKQTKNPLAIQRAIVLIELVDAFFPRLRFVYPSLFCNFEISKFVQYTSNARREAKKRIDLNRLTPSEARVNARRAQTNRFNFWSKRNLD